MTEDEPGKRRKGPPDGGWGWVVVAAAMGVVGLTFGIGGQGYSVLYNHIMVTFDSGAGATGWLISSYIMAIHISGFFGSVVTKKFGHRPVAVVSSVLGSLCMSMGAFAEELWQLCLMSGVFSGLFLGQTLYVSLYTSQLYFDKKRAVAGGLLSFCALYNMVAGPFAEWLTVMFGWRGALLILGGVLLNQAVLSAAFRPLSMEENEITLNGNTANGGHNSSQDITETKRTFSDKFLKFTCGLCDLSLYSEITVILCILAILLMNMANLVAISQLVNKAISVGSPSRSAATLPTLMAAGGLLGNVLTLLIIWILNLGVDVIYTIVLLMSGVLLAVIALVETFLAHAILLTAYGVVIGQCYFCHLTCLRNVTTMERYGHGLSALMMIWGLGALVVVPFAGVLYDVTGSYYATYLVAGAMMFVAGCCSFLMTAITMRKQRKHQKNTHTYELAGS